MRRHHCRLCGEVVCGECSKTRLETGSAEAGKARVCASCYDLSQVVLRKVRTVGWNAIV